MSSGPSWTRGAESAVPDQRHGDDEPTTPPSRSGGGNRGAWRSGGDQGTPEPEATGEDAAFRSGGIPGQGSSRKRWRDRSGKKGSEPEPDGVAQLGDEDYFSYLRGDDPPASFARDDDAPSAFDRGGAGPRSFGRGAEAPDPFDRGDEGTRSFGRGGEAPDPFGRGDEGPGPFGRGGAEAPVAPREDPPREDPPGRSGRGRGLRARFGRRNEAAEDRAERDETAPDPFGRDEDDVVPGRFGRGDDDPASDRFGRRDDDVAPGRFGRGDREVAYGRFGHGGDEIRQDDQATGRFAVGDAPGYADREPAAGRGAFPEPSRPEPSRTTPLPGEGGAPLWGNADADFGRPGDTDADFGRPGEADTAPGNEGSGKMGRLLRFTRKGRKAAAEEPPATPEPRDDTGWDTAGPSGTTRWDTGEPADTGWPGSGRPDPTATDTGWPGSAATDTGWPDSAANDTGWPDSGAADAGRSGPGAAPGRADDTDRWEEAASREHRGPTSLSEAPWRRNAPQRPAASAEDYWPTGEVGLHTPTTNGAAGPGHAAAFGPAGTAAFEAGGPAASGSAGAPPRSPVEGRSQVPPAEGRAPMRPPAEGRAKPRGPADDLLPGGHPAEAGQPGGLFGDAPFADAPPATRRPGDTPWPGGRPDEPLWPGGRPDESLWSESETSTHGAARTAPPGLPAPESDVPDRRAQWAALRDSMSTSDIGGPGPLPHYEPPAAWQKLLRSSRRERVRPGILIPVACTVLAGVGWLAAVGYGAWKLNLIWSLAALVAGLGGLVLALRGRRGLGLLPVLAGAAAWGMTTGAKVPDTFSDLAGDLRVVGWNVLYAVPLLAAYGCATWVDSKRFARDRVRRALGERRWCGAADVPDSEPTITALETIPSARFFALPDGSCAHLVVAGRRFALVRATVWPRGDYTATDLGEVHRNGRFFAHGSDDFNGVMADVRKWNERLDGAAPAGVGYLVVHPASDRPGEAVTIDIPETRGVRVLPADQFVAVAGEFLAAEPYRVDVALNERLGEHLPIFAV